MAQKYSQPYCFVKYMDLYIAVCCNIAYGTAAPSCGLLVYEQFSTSLKPLMTKVAEIPARWRCQHTFPYSDRITFSSFLTYIILFWMFLQFLDIPMTKHIIKSHPKMFSMQVWMCIYSDLSFITYSKFGQILTYRKSAWFLWSFSGFPHCFQ